MTNVTLSAKARFAVETLEGHDRSQVEKSIERLSDPEVLKSAKLVVNRRPRTYALPAGPDIIVIFQFSANVAGNTVVKDIVRLSSAAALKAGA